MNLLMKRLITDHKYITEIQGCLKQQMNLYFEQGVALDLDILLDIMYYLRNYMDCFHHPLEDRVYQKMRYRINDNALIEKLELMEKEHSQLKILTQSLQEDFIALEAGESVSDNKLKRDFLAYINTTEAHIELENKYLFPAIERFLLDTDLAIMERHMGQYADPDYEAPVPAAAEL